MLMLEETIAKANNKHHAHYNMLEIMMEKEQRLRKEIADVRLQIEDLKKGKG